MSVVESARDTFFRVRRERAEALEAAEKAAELRRLSTELPANKAAREYQERQAAQNSEEARRAQAAAQLERSQQYHRYADTWNDRGRRIAEAALQARQAARAALESDDVEGAIGHLQRHIAARELDGLVREMFGNGIGNQPSLLMRAGRV